MHQGRWDGTSEAYLNQAGWWGQAKLLQIKGRRGGPSEASTNKGRWGGVWRAGGLQSYECWRSHPGAAQAKNI